MLLLEACLGRVYSVATTLTEHVILGIEHAYLAASIATLLFRIVAFGGVLCKSSTLSMHMPRRQFLI